MAKLRTSLNRFIKRHMTDFRSRGRTFKTVSDKLGLVYFGAVDQHKDDHEVIRGITASTAHKDMHYAVGSHDGYDVILTDRVDAIIDKSGQEVDQYWMIIQVDLRSEQSLPYVFLHPRGADASAYTKLFHATSQLQTLTTAFTRPYLPEYIQRYETHGSMTHLHTIEEILTPSLAQAIAVHFWPFGVEIARGKVYVYITEHRPSGAVLERALAAAVWLASQFDKLDD